MYLDVSTKREVTQLATNALLCVPGVQEWLLQQVCASEAVEPVISNLVSVLLKGCQDSSPETRLLCGECLGELGAVDPGRLDLSRSHTNGGRNMFVVKPATLFVTR